MTAEFESEVRYMCNLSKSLVNQGVQQRIQQGEMKHAEETSLNLHGMGMNVDFIAKAVNVSVDLVKQWLGLIPA